VHADFLLRADSPVNLPTQLHSIGHPPISPREDMTVQQYSPEMLVIAFHTGLLYGKNPPCVF
jgi:hypothetical protein